MHLQSNPTFLSLDPIQHMSTFSPTNNENPDELPKLFVGPWVGELGVELLHWVGIARSAARSRHWGEVIASSWPDRSFLYKDFADRFVPITPPSEHTRGSKCYGYDESSSPWEDILNFERGDVWLSPFGDPDHFHRIRALAASESVFRDFSEGTQQLEERFDLLFHARATNKHNQVHKNWPVASWEALISSLPRNWRIASIGDPRGAHKIEGTEDLRGVSLDLLAAHCSAADMLVGPSSGPVHFAMQCGLPVLIWMGEHRHHYFPQWNPQDVPVVCFDKWQPSVEDVLARIRDLHLIVKSRRSPVRHIVFATKRSGHHAVTEWINQLNPSRHLVWLNDCVSTKIWTPPHCGSTIPTHHLLPKQLSEVFPRDLVTECGNQRRAFERVFSVEGAPIRLIPSLPEAVDAERIIFVLRDAANCVASFRRAFPQLVGREGFLGNSVREVIETYRDYLFEATGRTTLLGDLRSKTLFISYNRWHSDAAYRRLIAESLGCELYDLPRGVVSPYGPRSAFQHWSTNAEHLQTLNRWEDALPMQPLWVACRDPDLLQAEREFHGAALPLAGIEDVWGRLKSK